MARKIGVLCGLLCGVCASAAWAGPVYNVTVNTSALSGNDGAIYFQFNPGLNSDLASVRIDPFSIDPPGVLTGAPLTDGGVTGSLTALPLVIDNSGGLNDYLHFLTFGSTISFHVAFNLPAALVGDAGSAFVFALTGADGITPLLTQDPSGNLGEIDYDVNGAFTANSLAAAARISSAVPEPALAGPVFLLLLIQGAILFRRRISRASIDAGR
jgi:hypothetical protein